MLSKRAIFGIVLGSGAVIASTVPGGLGNLWLTNEFNKYSEKGFKQVYDTTAFGNTITYFVTPLILPLNTILSGAISINLKLRYCLLFNLCVIAGLTYYYIGDGYFLLQKLKKVDELRTQKKKLLLEGRD